MNEIKIGEMGGIGEMGERVNPKAVLIDTERHDFKIIDDVLQKITHMSRAESVYHLLKLCSKRTTTVDEVTALQMAVRSQTKRICDAMRSHKRADERKAKEVEA